nr:hydroxymyristoyl-ACP dehydratase [Streptomyces sp. RPA4-2]
MLTFDRLLELAEGERAVAVRNVPATLECFTAHFPRHPVLPGVLLLESLAALARTAGPRRLVPGRRARGALQALRRPRRPGPPHRRGEHSPQRTECRATARVEGRVVATVRALTLLSATTTREGTA